MVKLTLCFAIFAGVLVASLVAYPDEEQEFESSTPVISDPILPKVSHGAFYHELQPEAQKAYEELMKYSQEIVKNIPNLPEDLKEQFRKAFEEAKKLLKELSKVKSPKEVVEIFKKLFGNWQLFLQPHPVFWWRWTKTLEKGRSWYCR